MVHRLVTVSMYSEYIEARGHRVIKALHPSTFELTKDSDISERGDCIIGVKLDRGLKELDDDFKEAVRKDSSVIIMILQVDDFRDIVLARGSSKLILEDDRRIVIRRSRFIGPETLAIESSKAARDLDRSIIRKLQDPESILRISIYVLDLSEILSK